MAAYDCPKCGRFLCHCDTPAWASVPEQTAAPCATFQAGSEPGLCACGWWQSEHAAGGHL